MEILVKNEILGSCKYRIFCSKINIFDQRSTFWLEIKIFAKFKLKLWFKIAVFKIGCKKYWCKTFLGLKRNWCKTSN